MREILLQDDIQLVETELKKFELSTGCELLLIMANSSDPYPAASWRFGIISGFLISLVFSYYFEFHHTFLWPLSFFGLIFLMTWVGHFSWAKRWALSSWEVDRECLEKAIELFHTLGTSKVTHKVTAMIMVSVLEKKIQLLVDDQLKSKISQSDLDQLVLLMKEDFKKGNVGLGLVSSIQNLEKKIRDAFGGKASDAQPSELKDTIHFINV